MRHAISKQLDLWHVHDGIIATPTDLAWHLEINRRNAAILVDAIATDFEAAVGPITDILTQGHERSCIQDPIPVMDKETLEDWPTTTYDQEGWDTLTEVLNWIGLSEELKVKFTEKLLTECFPLIDPWIFDQAVKDAIELLVQQKSDFSEGDMVRAATHLIVSRIREAIVSRGESLALYAAIRLIVNEPIE